MQVRGAIRSAGYARGKTWVFASMTVAVSVLAAIAVAEAVLRLVPIPGITYHSFYYDDVTGGRYYPGSTIIHRNVNNEYIHRGVNSFGFVDVEHDEVKSPGIVRIGFFGDSYTQAMQVDLEDTFFRRVEWNLNKGSERPHYECLAFGVSGFSSLQSYLACKQWMHVTDLDYVVYVFVENDLGDQIRSLKASGEIPYAHLSGDTFVVDNTFREAFRYKNSGLHRAAQYAKSRSLVISTVVGRLKLLKKHGIKLRVTEAERQMAAVDAKTVNSNTPPSAWPDSLRAYATELGARVIAKWAQEVRDAGKRFLIVYIPRERELGNPPAEQDSFAQWLVEVCKRNAIELVDPTQAFWMRTRASGRVFHDHLTPSGHEELAHVITKYFSGVE